MNRDDAIKGHAKRLTRLSDEQVENLMTHAANKVPLLPVDLMDVAYVDFEGNC